MGVKPGSGIHAGQNQWEMQDLPNLLNTEHALQFPYIGTADRYRSSFISTHEDQTLVMLTFKTLDMVQVYDMAAVNSKKNLRIQYLFDTAERMTAKMIFVVFALNRRVMTVCANADDIRYVDEIGFLVFENRQFINMKIWLGYPGLGWMSGICQLKVSIRVVVSCLIALNRAQLTTRHQG